MFPTYLTENYKEDEIYNSQINLNTENLPFPSQNLDNNLSINTTLNSKNETILIRQCLSKDLLDTINSSILENEINENDILFSSLHTFNQNNNQKFKEENSPFNFIPISKNLNDLNTDINNIKNANNNNNEENCEIIIPIRKKKKQKKNFEVREGDWTCYFCKNLNFSFRKKCNRCGVNKDYSESQHDKCMEHVLSIINDNEKKRKESSLK